MAVAAKLAELSHLCATQRGKSATVIVTTPQIDFDWAGPLGSASGIVTPQVIQLDLGPGETAKPEVTVKVPPQLPMVDVFLLFDDTGSFAGTGPQLASAFPQLIDKLRQSLSNVDLGFGVGRFEDYGGDVVMLPALIDHSCLTSRFSQHRWLECAKRSCKRYRVRLPVAEATVRRV